VDIAGVVVRIAFTYVFLLVIVRLAGKRTIREGTPFDFLVALMLGDFPDDVIWGEVPIVQGVVAIGVVMTLHLIVSYASHRSIRVDQLLGAAPDLLLRDGRSDPRGLRHARMNEGDLDVEVRRAGRTTREGIAEARLEATGEVALRLSPDARPARREHLGQRPRS
jgi:uncharacterized membrane protein YcaP (DUF421 family)